MKINKHGAAFTTILALIIFLLLLVWFILGPYQKMRSTSEIPGQLTGCSVKLYPGIKGTCRETCEPSETLKFEGNGCPPQNDKKAVNCCIDPNYQSPDVGGDEYYNFEVVDIGLDAAQLNGNCKETSDNTYTCTSGKITVKMEVTNTGDFDLFVFANPKVGESYPNQGQAILIPKKNSKTLTANLDLEQSKSYKIYGAAKCDDTICKEKFGDEGIFRLNDYQYITVAVG
ncbi:MAG: hypothetical protein ACP5NV_02595 [Candidatus Woesearchaeota archaeon]